MGDICHKKLTYASALYQTGLPTGSHQLGTFSVGARPLFKSEHSNPVYKLSGDKCTECVISRCETQPNLSISTSSATTWRSGEGYRITAVYAHTVDTPPGFSITDRKITDGTQSARHRKFYPHTQSTYNSHLPARAQNGHL